MGKRDKCTRCGSTLFGMQSGKCSNCGEKVLNFCGECDHINPENAARCELCGQKTVYMLAGMSNLAGL